jgi:hypothetical protein
LEASLLGSVLHFCSGRLLQNLSGVDTVDRNRHYEPGCDSGDVWGTTMVKRLIVGVSVFAFVAMDTPAWAAWGCFAQGGYSQSVGGHGMGSDLLQTVSARRCT